MTTDTSGPAFPCHPGVENSIYDGMTLRDYFASKAMQSIVKYGPWSDDVDMEEIARLAYQQADAMLKARKA
jgi:hypothetical protein